MNRLSLSLIAVALTLASLFQGGCFTNGGGLIGATDERSYQYDEAAQVNKGMHIAITLTDGTRHEGQFAGLTQLPESKVVERYQSPMQAWPTWQTPLTATSKPGDSPRTVVDGAFCGFSVEGSYDYLYRQYRQTYSLILKDDETERSVILSDLESLTDQQGVVYDVHLLNQLIADQRLPLVTALALDQDENRVLLPLDELALIHQPRQRKPGNTALGILVGTTAAAFILYAVATDDWYWAQ